MAICFALPKFSPKSLVQGIAKAGVQGIVISLCDLEICRSEFNPF